MLKQFFYQKRFAFRSKRLLRDNYWPMGSLWDSSVRARTNFSKSRGAHVAETASEERWKLARNYLQNRRKLIRNCLWKERKFNQIFLPNTGENLRDIFSQNQRKLSSKSRGGIPPIPLPLAPPLDVILPYPLGLNKDYIYQIGL